MTEQGERKSMPHHQEWSYQGQKRHAVIPCGVDDQQLISIVKSYPDIPVLWLRNTTITDIGLRALAENTIQLDALDIEGGVDITDQGLKCLSELPCLTEFQWRSWWPKLTGAGLKHLKNFKKLEILRLPPSPDIDSIVEVLSQLPQLKQLFVPESAPVSRSLQRTHDAQAILEAWRNGEEVLDLRIVIAGMEGVGKSCLLRRCFLDEVVSIDEPRSITDDIELLHEQDLRWKPGNRSIEPRRLALHLWDLGGQLVKHGIHEIFFADNDHTLYLLVLSATRPLERRRGLNGEETGNGLNYWLQMINRYAGDRAPVLIAVTQCDRTGSGTAREVDKIIGQSRELFRAKWGVNVIAPVVDGCSACDAAATSIKPLREAIQNAVLRLAYSYGLRPEPVENVWDDGFSIGDRYASRMPKGLCRLRTHVSEKIRSRTIIPIDEFRTWCAECGVHDRRRQGTYLRVLHEMGLLFYFGLTDAEKEDHAEPPWWQRQTGRRSIATFKPDSCLQLNVVNPQWWKKPIYKLLECVDGKAWQRESDINEAIRPVTAGFPDSSIAAQVIRESLVFTELCFYDEKSRMYLFPRALPDIALAATNQWRCETATFSFFTEAAFFRFTVKLHARGNVCKVDEAFAHYRWSLLACSKDDRPTRVAIVARPDDGELEFRFDDQSDPIHRLNLARQLYEIFRIECMSGEGPAPEDVFKNLEPHDGSMQASNPNIGENQVVTKAPREIPSEVAPATPRKPPKPLTLRLAQFIETVNDFFEEISESHTFKQGALHKAMLDHPAFRERIPKNVETFNRYYRTVRPWLVTHQNQSGSVIKDPNLIRLTAISNNIPKFDRPKPKPDRGG